MDLNLELRTEVLSYSLHLEEGVNNLLLLNLGILDGGKSSRLFGNKAGINFKNKIDLLYDLEIFNKVENAEMELLSVFRNKLLHDITFSSLLSVIQNLDSGLRSKFKSYLEEHDSIESEEHCRRALTKIFLKNIQTIKAKVQQLRELNNSKRELIQENLKVNLQHIDIFYDFIGEICLQVEEAELENPVLARFAEELIKTIQKHQDLFSGVEKRPFEFEVFASLFGVRKMNAAQVAGLKTLYEEYYNARQKPI